MQLFHRLEFTFFIIADYDNMLSRRHECTYGIVFIFSIGELMQPQNAERVMMIAVDYSQNIFFF